MPCLHGLHGPTIIPNGQYWLVKNGIPQLILKMGIMMVNYPIDWGLEASKNGDTLYTNYSSRMEW